METVDIGDLGTVDIDAEPGTPEFTASVAHAEKLLLGGVPGGWKKTGDPGLVATEALRRGQAINAPKTYAPTPDYGGFAAPEPEAPPPVPGPSVFLDQKPGVEPETTAPPSMSTGNVISRGVGKTLAAVGPTLSRVASATLPFAPVVPVQVPAGLETAGGPMELPAGRYLGHPGQFTPTTTPAVPTTLRQAVDEGTQTQLAMPPMPVPGGVGPPKPIFGGGTGIAQPNQEPVTSPGGMTRVLAGIGQGGASLLDAVSSPEGLGLLVGIPAIAKLLPATAAKVFSGLASGKFTFDIAKGLSTDRMMELGQALESKDPQAIAASLTNVAGDILFLASPRAKGEAERGAELAAGEKPYEYGPTERPSKWTAGGLIPDTIKTLKDAVGGQKFDTTNLNRVTEDLKASEEQLAKANARIAELDTKEAERAKAEAEHVPLPKAEAPVPEPPAEPIEPVRTPEEEAAFRARQGLTPEAVPEGRLKALENVTEEHERRPLPEPEPQPIPEKQAWTEALKNEPNRVPLPKEPVDETQVPGEVRPVAPVGPDQAPEHEPVPLPEDTAAAAPEAEPQAGEVRQAGEALPLPEAPEGEGTRPAGTEDLQAPEPARGTENPEDAAAAAAAGPGGRQAGEVPGGEPRGQVPPGVGQKELRHLEAVREARRAYVDEGPGEPGVHAAFGIEEAKAKIAHEDATRTVGQPRNTRDMKRDLLDTGHDPDLADAYAKTFDKRVQESARVRGVSPEEIYKTLRVEKDGTVTGEGALHQMAPTNEEFERLSEPGELQKPGKARDKTMERARGLLRSQTLEHLVASAKGGAALKDWYPAMRKMIGHIVGNGQPTDPDTFIDVMAATSPMQSVAENVKMTLALWMKWLDAGRPVDTKSLRKIAKSVPAAWMGSRLPNVIRAFQGQPLSGPKINPFSRNIHGEPNPVTLDRIEGQRYEIPQRKFSTEYGALAGTHLARAVAEKIKWESRQVQAGGWGLWQALGARMGMYGDPYQALLRLTNEDVIKAGSLRIFNDILENDPKVREEAKRRGLNVDDLPAIEPPAGVEPGGRVLENEGVNPEDVAATAYRRKSLRDERLANEDLAIPAPPTLTIFHASPHGGLDQILPEKQGTGQAGAERARMTADDFTKYSHFYTADPNTDVENHRFGGKHVYGTTFELTNEPGGLINDKLLGSRSYGKLKEQGYTGVYYPEHGEVHVLNPTDVSYGGRAASGGKPILKAPDYLAGVKNIGQSVHEAHLDSIDEKTGEGGSTTHPDTGYTLQVGKDTGYVVSPYKNLELPLDHAPTPKDIHDFARKNYDVLHEDPRNQIGTWAPGDGGGELAGKHVLDVSRHVDDYREAMKIGQENDQQSYFDVKNGKVIPVNEAPEETEGAVPLFQDRTAPEPKGSITFGVTHALIKLGKTADFTTFGHEMWHWARRNYFEDLEKALPEHRERIQQVVDNLNKWVGAKDGNWTTEQEEKFARGGELFLRTGDAPTPDLRGAFETLRDYFRKVYADLKGSPIETQWTPEARDAYRQMLGEGTTEATSEGGRMTAERGLPEGSVGAAARGKPMDDQPIGAKIASAFGLGAQTPKIKENFSRMGAEKDLFGGYGHNQLAEADVKSAEAARYMAGAPSKAKHLIDQAMPQITRALGFDTKDTSFERKAGVAKFFDALASNRLEGIRDKADDIAREVTNSSDAELQDAVTNGRFDTLVDALEGRKGFEDRDLQDEWAKQVRRVETGPDGVESTREFLGQLVNDWKDGIGTPETQMAGAFKTTDPTSTRAAYDAYVAGPEFRKALDVYKSALEEPMRKAHALNEGVFTEHLGPLDTYFPLSSLNELAPSVSAGGRTTPYRKPKNPNNFFATGLGEYDTSTEPLRRNIARSIAQNGKAGLVTSLQESGLLQPLKPGQDSPGSMMWNGEEYTAKTVDIGAKYMISGDGKVEAIPSTKATVPEWLAKELKPLLEPEHLEHTKHILKDVLNATTAINLGGPTDAVYHSANLIGTLALRAPIVGTSIAAKVSSYVPLVKSIAAIANVMAIDPTAPKYQERIQRMIENGQIPSRYGEATYSKEYAETTGAQKAGMLQLPWHVKEGKLKARMPVDFSPMIFGPKGVDMRARVLMDVVGEHIAQAQGIEWTPQEAFNWTRQMGNYVYTLEGRIERAAKASGWAPFYTAGRQMNVNGIAGMLGVGHLPVRNQTFNQYRAAQLTSGIVGVTALWAVMNRLYRDKWPWEDEESRLWQIPLTAADRDTKVARMLYGDDVSKTAYVNIAGFNALMARGARITGVKAGLEGALTKRSFAETTDRATVDAMNGWLHPFLGPPTHTLANAALGSETYIDRLHTNGRPDLVLRPAVAEPLEPGLVGWGQKAKQAAFGSNPIVRRSQQAHEEGAPAGRVIADTILPNFIKGPYRSNDSALGTYLKDYQAEHPFAGKPMTVEERQGRDKITGWTSRLRSALDNKDTAREATVVAEMDAAAAAGKLADKDRTKIEKDASMPKNAAMFSRLPLQNAIEAYEKANTQQRAELAPYLERKKPPTDMSEEEATKLEDRVEELLAQ